MMLFIEILLRSGLAIMLIYAIITTITELKNM